MSNSFFRLTERKEIWGKLAKQLGANYSGYNKRLGTAKQHHFIKKPLPLLLSIDTVICYCSSWHIVCLSAPPIPENNSDGGTFNWQNLLYSCALAAREPWKELGTFSFKRGDCICLLPMLIKTSNSLIMSPHGLTEQ